MWGDLGGALDADQGSHRTIKKGTECAVLRFGAALLVGDDVGSSHVPYPSADIRESGILTDSGGYQTDDEKWCQQAGREPGDRMYFFDGFR